MPRSIIYHRGGGKADYIRLKTSARRPIARLNGEPIEASIEVADSSAHFVMCNQD